MTRTEPDGTITVIADSFEGKRAQLAQRCGGEVGRLDLVHRSRLRPAAQLPGRRARTGAAIMSFASTRRPARRQRSSTTSTSPMGSPSRPTSRMLYVADSAVTDGPGRNSHIRRFRGRRATARSSGGEVFATTVGIPDGMRVDTEGNVWASAGTEDRRLRARRRRCSARSSTSRAT